ncbi:hypothetical protein ACFE04_011563 [Oxalis oulophora]
MKAPSNGFSPNSTTEGDRKNINSELWHACAGPLVSLPPVGSLVVYFPQGHSEQVAASMQKEADFIPSYPNLPSKLICMLHNVTLHADIETDEVYAQMTLQPVSKYDKEALLTSEMALKHNRQPAEFFCKTLTASDTSTHGGFSVPRRAAEKIFPPLDFSMQPPAQELAASDLHNNSWTFRHIYRGQPKRHLLTSGWSVFVSTKRLFAGDSVLFIRDEKQQLLLGIKRANRQQSALASSVISSDSMHIGILAAAAHAAANNSPFTIFFNPRASPSEFVVPFAKYNKAMYTQVSPGMRFRMLFETEESGVRRYMGTITGTSDFDPVRWKNSQWRNLQVGWDESTAGDRPSRVSIWEIEPVVSPFYICPPPFFRPKFPGQPGMPGDESDMENAFKRAMPWLGDDFGMKDSVFPGLSLVQWMNMQQNGQFPNAQPGFFPPGVSPAGMHNSNVGIDDPSKLLNFQSPGLTQANMQFNKSTPVNNGLAPANQNPSLQQLFQSPPVNNGLQPPNQNLSQNQTQQQQLFQSATGNNGFVSPNQTQQQQLFQSAPVSNGFVSPNQNPSQHQQQQQPFQSAPVHNSLLSPNRIPGQTQQQQLFQSTTVNNGLSSPNQTLSQHQQQQLTRSGTPPSSLPLAGKNSFLPQDSPFQQQVDTQPNSLQRQQQQAQLQLLQQSLFQRAQLSMQGVTDQQLQLQLLQKLQQQQQQLVSAANSLSQPQTVQENHSLQKSPQSQNQQPLTSDGFSASALVQSQQYTGNQPPTVHKPPTLRRAQSGVTDGDAPSCSTSPSSNNCQVPPSSFVNRNQQIPAQMMGNSVIEPVQTKNELRIKLELQSMKGPPDQLRLKGDQLEASCSGTSFGLETNNHHNFSLPPLDVQSHSRNSIPFTPSIDGLGPDTLLSRGFDSQKDLQNLLANYGGNPRDIETELSTADISSPPFGVPDMAFKPGSSTDIGFDDTGVISNEFWANQTQPRLRTYTKVQKRGSVGRSIDVTRYQDYDGLRRDLARMFGIEGQLEDPQNSEWKLVFMDPENDMLLVGDDPWEDFVRCVQSIKILSAVEVQNMSLAGDLGSVPIANQASSGTDSGNAWRGQYDDNSAASFNR